MTRSGATIDQSSDSIVAEAALVLLSGQLQAKPSHWLMADEGGEPRSIERSDLISELRRRAKPVACGITQSGERATVSCGRLDREEEDMHARWTGAFRSATGFFGMLASTRWRGYGSMVLVTSVEGRVTLPSHDLERLVGDYFLRGLTSFGLRAPTLAESQQRIRLVLESSRTEPYAGPIPPE